MIISTSWSFSVSALTTVPATRPSRRTVIAVGHGQRFVQVVGHEEHARPVRDAPADDFEEPVPVGAGQEHGRLVEDQQSAARVVVLRVLGQVLEGTHDGQQRAFHGGQVGDPRARIEVQAEPREGLLGPLVVPCSSG